MLRIARPLAAALAALSLALAPAVLPAAGALANDASPAVSAAAGDEVTWSVEPVITSEGQRRTFKYTVDPGTQVVDSVVISNRGETAADFIVYATDAINEFETGAFGLLKRDETPTDAGAWITTADSELTLQPGTSATVPFNLLVPSDAAPGDHVAGIVAAVLTKGEQDGAAVTLEQRVGARVYLTVSGIPDAAVEVSGSTAGFNASFNPFAPGDVDLAYTVTNTGNTRLDVNQAVQVTGPFGIPLGEYTPEPISDLLPRQSVRVVAEVPQVVALLLTWSNVSIEPGEVGSAGVPLLSDEPPVPVGTESPTPTPTPTDDATVETVDTDAEAIVYKSVTASVMALSISWTLLLLVVVVIAVLYLIVRYVSGTRERMYEAIDEAAAAAREEALAGQGEAVK